MTAEHNTRIYVHTTYKCTQTLPILSGFYTCLADNSLSNKWGFISTAKLTFHIVIKMTSTSHHFLSAHVDLQNIILFSTARQALWSELRDEVLSIIYNTTWWINTSHISSVLKSGILLFTWSYTVCEWQRTLTGLEKTCLYFATLFRRVVFDIKITCKAITKALFLNGWLPLKNTEVQTWTNCQLLITSHVLHNHILLQMENAKLNLALK